MFLVGLAGMLVAILATVLLWFDLARFCVKSIWLLQVEGATEDDRFSFQSDLSRKLSVTPLGIGSFSFVGMLLTLLFVLGIPESTDYKAIIGRLLLLAFVQGVIGSLVLWWGFHCHLMPSRNQPKSGR